MTYSRLPPSVRVSRIASARPSRNASRSAGSSVKWPATISMSAALRSPMDQLTLGGAVPSGDARVSKPESPSASTGVSARRSRSPIACAPSAGPRAGRTPMEMAEPVSTADVPCPRMHLRPMRGADARRYVGRRTRRRCAEDGDHHRQAQRGTHLLADVHQPGRDALVPRRHAGDGDAGQLDEGHADPEARASSSAARCSGRTGYSPTAGSARSSR